ncbi:MAG: CRTAC1 family protein [Planctomycetes bacterium]|nr:CRTAC1 family protein [Planctomycetota bacterium]
MRGRDATAIGTAGALLAAVTFAAQEGGDCCGRAPRRRDPTLPPLVDRKSTLLRELGAKLVESDALFYGRAPLSDLAARAAALPAAAPVEQRFDLLFALADARLCDGDLAGATRDYEACLALAQGAAAREAEVAVARQLAIVALRQAERDNCVAAHGPESCIVPFADGALHRDRRGSEAAIARLAPLLAADPGDLRSLWLLNVAHMTLGTWPAGVPEAARLPADAFASEAEFPRFRDAAQELGLATVGLAGGAVMDDLDGDGRLDVVVTSSAPDESLGCFLQQADGTFVDRAEALGLAGQLGGFQCFAHDWNGDGRLDLLVQRGAWTHRHGELPNSLLLQQADGTFVDRTREAGLEIRAPSLVAASADIDLDGDLDLFLGYESLGKGSAEDYPCRLFKNRGDATFEEITEQAGVRNDALCKGALFGDYDGDRDPDLYVSNLGGKNRLYRNEGDGTFVDVAAALGVEAPIKSFACAFLDANQDGWLDLWVSCYATPATRPLELAAWYLRRERGADTQRLYLNDGRGGFRDATRAFGLERVVFPMGANFGDLDHDGYPDLYLATGDPEFASLWPNVLLKNDRGRRFQDVTTASGTGHLQKGHGVAIGDLDGDGDEDLFVEIGGVLRDDAFPSALFRNPGNGKRWLTVRPRGKQSDRFAIGARLSVTLAEPAGERTVHHWVGGNASFGGNSLQAELGLGEATRIVALEIRWPRTGLTQRFTEVPLDAIVELEEGASELRVVARPGR